MVLMWLAHKMQADSLFLTSVHWLLLLGRRRFRSGLDRNEGDVSVSLCSVAGQTGLCPALLPACVGSFLFRGKGSGYLICSMPAHPALGCFQTLPIKIPLVWQPQPATADRAGYQPGVGQSLPGQHIKVGWVSLCRAPEKSQVPQTSSHQLLYWTPLGLGHARISCSCHPSHTCAMGTNEVCTGKNYRGGWECL